MKIINEGSETGIKIEKEETKNLMTVLQKHNIFPGNSCNGNGTCGKCKIRVANLQVSVTDFDRKCLSDREVESGVRLACKIKISELLELEKKEEVILEVLGNPEENIFVEKATFMNEISDAGEQDIDREYTEIDAVKDEFFVAIDIGTTTIAMALVNKKTGEICDTYASLNHQRRFGADIISRIQVSNEGKAHLLKQSIEEDLWNGIKTFVQVNEERNADADKDKETSYIREITKIVIAGNTTMIHLLMGYSCETLGKYPFFSKHCEQMECRLSDCITILNEGNESVGKIPVTILPGISAFVGGDIVSGLLVCPGFETEELNLLIDLGTNGEIVLGNKKKLLVTSAAAGPVFEGGNIVCGMASIPGSICRVKMENRRVIVKTIGNVMPPVGICGTGLVSIISQLIQNKQIKTEGELVPPYDKNGITLGSSQNGQKVALYSSDVRQFQMAKAAIRSGIEVLIQEYGCKVSEIKNIYLAGGMGVHLLEEDAICVGMIPEEFRGKIKVVGNAALSGAIEYGKREKNEDKIDLKDKIHEIILRTQVVSLAKNECFEKLYFKYMEF